MFPEVELREGWVTVVCLLFMSLCVAWAIQAAGWTDGLTILQGTVLGGGIVGIVLAKSRVPNRLAHLLSILAGWTWAVYLTSQVLTSATQLPLAAAVAELETLFYALFFIPFVEGASADNHVFLLLLAFLLWWMAYFCAWAVFRWQRVWWAVIVCGLALLVNISYAPRNLTIYLILFLLSALLLVVRASVAAYVQEWHEARVGYSSELISSFLRAGLIFSVVVILLAWIAPAALASRPLQPFWDRISEPWRQLQERSARIFQDLNYQNQPPLVSLGDRRMWFGGPVELGDIPVADVAADAGRYWRVMAFHEYRGDGWLSNDPDVILIGPNERDLAFPQLDLRFEMTQTVTVQRDWGVDSALIAAAQPLRAAIPLRASVSDITYTDDVDRYPDPAAAPSAPGDPSALYSREPLAAGDSYQIYSSLTEVDEESLRQAGTDYPNWVRSRYLQLPDSLPERVRQRAEQITADRETPYDEAKAIESFLRQIPYDEQIEGPRLGQDGVDYFLFDAQAGYCDYYSSAMVVMLRAVGVPARFVRGYSQSAKEGGLYRLLESDGHAWPEVFFPGYGWIEFEPTGGEPPLDRPRPPEEEADEPIVRRDRPNLRRDFDPMEEGELNRDLMGPMPTPPPVPLWQRVGPWGWFALALTVLGAGAFVTLTAHRRHQIEGLSVTERVYEDLVSWVRRLMRIDPLEHQTPLEFAGIVVRQVPRSREAVERIAGLYVEERFGGKAVAGADAEIAWRQAWPALWHRWLEDKVERVRRIWWRLVPPQETNQP